MNALAHAAIDQLALVRLRLERCEVPAQHRYKMLPAPVERFVYITKGSACFSLQEEKLSAGSRDMVYLPGDTAYDSQWLEDSYFVVVDILLQDAQGRTIRFDEVPSVLFHDTHGVYDGLLSELARKADVNGPFDWLERLSLTFKLLCEMARDTNREELDMQNRAIKAGLTYLENNYTGNYSVEFLAELCSMSEVSFRRNFVACKGMSPVEYRNRLRVQRAVELLKHGGLTVAEVAEQVGIPDLKYFGKLFKRYVGITPRELKNSVPDEQ